ncbi:MAG: extracellular solute-binding protein [Burkholderiales bacterium]|nr:extracellular solute-binding protein [Burkholderiales bacterium]
MKPACAFFLVALCLAIPARAATEITLWHSLDGAAGEELGRLALRFNAAQTEFRVVPEYKGGYETTLAAGLAALPNGRAPDILQVDEAMNSRMLAERSAFRPLYQVMSESRERFDPRAFIGAIAERYSDERGRLLSLPLNATTAVLYYNRDLFLAAGLDPGAAPRTWQEVQAAALASVDSGSSDCGFTTELPAWVQVENLLASHGEPLDDDSRGSRRRFAFNTSLVMKHVGMLASWVQSGIFSYLRRDGAAEAKFAAGQCAMLTAASDAYLRLARHPNLTFGVAPLPYHDDAPGAPFATLAGGASLWAMAGRKSRHYSGIARFFSFLLRPDVQSQWLQATGFLPLTRAAFELSRQQGFYATHAGMEVGVTQLITRKPPRGSVRQHHSDRVRRIIDEELEAVWSRRKTTVQGLDDAVTRGNLAAALRPPPH